MTKLYASSEFAVGKYHLGNISSGFYYEFVTRNQSFEKRNVPSFQFIPRYMTDEEIRSELKPQICELGDILAFLQTPPDQSGFRSPLNRPSIWNVFFLENLTVCVHWAHGGWSIFTYDKGSTLFGFQSEGTLIYSPRKT